MGGERRLRKVSAVHGKLISGFIKRVRVADFAVSHDFFAHFLPAAFVGSHRMR